jgi:epoxyqueuosine reductase
LNACPTNAFPQPYVLDARRCISYLTIEFKGSIPSELRPLMGNWVYGCDVCQEVCPFVRRFTPETREDLFRPVAIDRAAPPLADLLTMTPDDFQARFTGSAILRIGYERLLRNACIAVGNSAARELLPHLETIARRSDDLLLAAEHAAWAVQRIRGLL